MTLGVWTGHCSGPGLDCHTGDVTPGEELQHSRGQDTRHQLVKLRCQGSAINNLNCFIDLSHTLVVPTVTNSLIFLKRRVVKMRDDVFTKCLREMARGCYNSDNIKHWNAHYESSSSSSISLQENSYFSF